MTNEELQFEINRLKSQIRKLTDEFRVVKTLDLKPQLINWPTGMLNVKKISVVGRGADTTGTNNGYFVGSTNFITNGLVIWHINSVAQNWNPNADNTYSLGSSDSFRWANIKSVQINGATPLAGTKIYYVADSSGGAVTRKLTFVNGILTSEV